MIEKAQADFGAVQDWEFPGILIYNLPMQGFVETGFKDYEQVKKQLISAVQKLEQAGSDFIIIACNTVHYFYHAMQTAVKIPIVNLLKISSDLMATEGYKKIGILSSESTNLLSLYKTELEAMGLEFIGANKKQQGMINKVILAVLEGKHGKDQVKVIVEIIKDMKLQGAEAILLGCTELPLVLTKVEVAGLPVYSSLDILADQALESNYGNKDWLNLAESC